MHGDNAAAIDLAIHGGYRAKSKHIDLKFHMIQEWIKEGDISVHWIPTDKNIADVMTKPLDAVKHALFTSAMVEE